MSQKFIYLSIIIGLLILISFSLVRAVVVENVDLLKLVPKATAPASPSQGWIYYDSGADMPKIYKATGWSDADTKCNTSGTCSQVCIGADCKSSWPSGIGGSGTANYISKFTTATTLGNSLIQDNGSNIGMGIAPSTDAKLGVYNTADGLIKLTRSGTTQNYTFNLGTDGALAIKDSGANVRFKIDTNGNVFIPGLVSCNTIDTNTSGQLSCGTDAVNDTVSSSELDNLCATNDRILKRSGGSWSCAIDQTDGGVTDHGALTGLGDDDHPQYVLDEGDIMSGNLTLNDGDAISPRLYLDSTSGNYSLRNYYGTLQFKNNAGSTKLEIGQDGYLTINELTSCDTIDTDANGQLFCGTDADTDTWQANTQAQEGYVSAGSTNYNKVWKTDGSGNPGWRTDADTDTDTRCDIDGTCSYVYADNDLIADDDVSAADDVIFYGDLKPDGLTCSNGQILKRTGADNWDCVDMPVATNTNASTLCTGTDVYLDGEGNCDTVVDTDTTVDGCSGCLAIGTEVSDPGGLSDGDDGFTSCQRRGFSDTEAGRIDINVSCFVNTHRTGGGWDATGIDDSSSYFIDFNAPNTSNGWHCAGNDPGLGSWTLTCYVICCQ